MQQDRAISLRIPLDLAHALDAKLNSILANRKPSDRAPPGRDGHKVKNMSDLMRECLWLGLKLNARDPELIDDLKSELIAEDVKAILASAVHNRDALKTLQKIAAEADSDFG
jgi:hypothetical protein